MDQWHHSESPLCGLGRVHLRSYEFAYHFNHFLSFVHHSDLVEVHVKDVKCALTPMLAPAPHFAPTYQPDPATTKSVDLGPYHLEFSGRSVFIFATFTKPRSRERVVFREEYFMFHASTFTNNRRDPIDSSSEFGDRPVDAFVLEPSLDVTKPDPDTVVSRANLGNGSFVFYFMCRYREGTLKYSTEVRSAPSQAQSHFVCPSLIILPDIGYVWKNVTGAPFFILPVLSAFRAAHSPQGASLRCTSNPFSQTCVSRAGSKFSVAPDSTGSAAVTMTTNTTSFKFSYNGLNGTLDGRPFNFLSNRIELKLTSIFAPLGRLEYVQLHEMVNLGVDLPTGPDSDQVVYNILLGSVGLFNNSFFYDPEVTITLLFNPEDALAPEAGASQQDTNIAVIVGVVVTIVVVLLGVTVFAFVIFPFLKRRQEERERQATEPIVSNDSDNGSGNGDQETETALKRPTWSAASPRDRASMSAERESIQAS
jgi:hypothetical protein